MFIKEVVIDGFKSYATRTVLQGFDPHFNAITGLNGSGKSNILDAICFVLGISNLSQVRVANVGELVYKQGQAGVTKATVTLVFNNADKKGRWGLGCPRVLQNGACERCMRASLHLKCRTVSHAPT